MAASLPALPTLPLDGCTASVAATISEVDAGAAVSAVSWAPGTMAASLPALSALPFDGCSASVAATVSEGDAGGAVSALPGEATALPPVAGACGRAASATEEPDATSALLV